MWCSVCVKSGHVRTALLALLTPYYAAGSHRSAEESLQLPSSAKSVVGAALSVSLNPLLGLVVPRIRGSCGAVVPGAGCATAGWCAAATVGHTPATTVWREMT